MLRNAIEKISSVFHANSVKPERKTRKNNQEPRKLSPEEQHLWTVSQFENILFLNTNKNGLYLFHISGQFNGTQPYETVEGMLNATNNALDYFQSKKNSGINEITIPKDMPFHHLSERFVETVEKNSEKRLELAQRIDGVCITKNKVDIDVIIKTLLECKNQFEYGLDKAEQDTIELSL